MAHPVVSPRTYVTIYLCLLGLTTLTVYLAMQAQLGAWEVPVALGIATVKTILVGLFFMHLLHAGRLMWIIIMVGVLFLVVMLGLTWTDYLTRGWIN
jgi:cytochrome c oxidase subunit 4